MIFVGIFGLSILIASDTYARSTSKIDTAVNVVSQLCLSGTEYGIEADLEGNITIKSFKPKGSGSVTLNVRESKGATSFQEDLRIIADENVRKCTQSHIGRILDAVLDVSEPQKLVKKSNKSISQAKYLGYVPDQVSIQASVEGTENLFYRFSVKEPSNIQISFSRNSQQVSMYLLTKSDKSIDSGSFSNGKTSKKHFLLPGDYYVKVKCKYKDRATAFKMIIEGFPAA
jgi:hypothetical protein